MMETIYLHRDKEDNWDLIDKAKGEDFKNYDNLKWLGLEIGLRVEVRDDDKHKVLEVNSRLP